MKEEHLKLAAANLGEGVTFKGLMSKKAQLKHGYAKEAKDVAGWNYVVKEAASGVCYSYYAAQPPLIGMTRPVVIKCPLGVRAFDSYKIDFKEAINIFHKLDCGDAFTEMTLYYVLYPGVTEPHWYIRSVTGCTVVIGADSGKVMDPIHRD
ncbi:hypothetical protein Mpet_0727 [Methanolacinia petrolearia DSM 11571]|jgi:hypothetical protein|uniref:Uncharacterized protein n=1 Tax=Methanolacinia petrolearia (strain DSM 11571 / OCM 486 / SEBR 4847) TaxID=679926 RepID=E1RII8_METP4|nr:hypothetical protein [Methanolacinia petrolearia]ADN35501.1 hypothetical protein Mpet_0727 [Methanolacinia petrolearia DSM 11571]